MSTRNNHKSPRTKSPIRIKVENKSKTSDKSQKKKPVKNTFDIVQFKKLLGKGMIKIYTGVIVDKKFATSEESKKIKEKVLDGSIKSIGMTGYINEGIIYIFIGVERLLVISGISYLELKKAHVEAEVSILQYGKLTKEEINSLI
jgi:hypothetical protein